MEKKKDSKDVKKDIKEVKVEAKPEPAKEVKEEAEEKPLDTKKLNQEMKWAVGIMVGLIVFVVVFYFVFQSVVTSMRNFEYQGLAFTKERIGEIDIFHHYYYYDFGGQTYKYNLYLRGDPRKNNASVKGFFGDLLRINRINDFAYISINETGLTNCSNSAIAIASLSSLFANNKIKIKSAVPDKEVAEARNITYASCENNPDNVVVMIGTGEETETTAEGNCYKITASNCHILEAIEKFEVQAIADAISSNPLTG